MSALPSSLRPSAFVLGVLVGALPAGAQLASVSPFMPTPAAGGVGAPTPGAPLEFRAMMETKEGTLYRIVDPARKNAGAFVRLNEREPNLNFVVKQHDGSGDNETVVVEQGGRTFTLPLRSAKVVSSGAPGMVPPPPPQMTNMPPAIAQSVVVNPTPADEQRRLEAVAAEVARRRALREQATQQINQGVPVAPQVIQQQQEMMRQQNAQQQGNQQGPRGNNQGGPRGGQGLPPQRR